MLALVVGLAQLGVALAIGSLPLVLCSLCALTFVGYDFERMVRCFDEPRWFLRRDLAVILLQVAVVAGAALIWGQVRLARRGLVGSSGAPVVCLR